MAINASGPISLGGATTGQSVALELALGATAQISLNDASVRTLAGVPSGAITMPTNFYSKSYLSNVSLLLRGNGTNGGTTFIDSSPNAFTVTPSGNAQTSTAQIKYGSSSMLFDGNGDYLSVPYNSALDLIGSSFTIEAWIYPTITKVDGVRIFSTGGGAVGWSATTGIHVLFQIQNTAGNLSLQISNNTITPISTLSTSTVPVNTWTHVAAVYDGANNVKLFINGQMESFTIATPARPSTNPTAAIATLPGEVGGVTWAYQGYIDDLMISKGVAKYTSSFTPPGAF